MGYMICRDTSFLEFVLKVNDKIGEGYGLQGGPFMFQDHDKSYWCHALVRYE